MKTSLFIATLLLSQSAFAGTLVELASGPGYVAPKDEYNKVCMLSDTGLATYTYTVRGQMVKQTRVQFSKEALTQVVEDIELARADAATPANITPYMDGGGDLPGFSLVGYPEDSSRMLSMHGRGKDLTTKSFASKQILNAMTEACGMTLEILKMKIFGKMN